jgi:hypothetical protein
MEEQDAGQTAVRESEAEMFSRAYLRYRRSRGGLRRHRSPARERRDAMIRKQFWRQVSRPQPLGELIQKNLHFPSNVSVFSFRLAVASVTALTPNSSEAEPQPKGPRTKGPRDREKNLTCSQRVSVFKDSRLNYFGLV